MIDWTHIENFKPHEFSEDPDLHAEERLIETLDQWRSFIGVKVHPSPVEGALARFSGNETSRHYAVGRRSDAIDVFVECNIRRAWFSAIRSKMWGGIGVYFDTEYGGKKWDMLHLDLREDALTLWYRTDKKYYYPDMNDNDLQGLFGLLNNA